MRFANSIDRHDACSTKSYALFRVCFTFTLSVLAIWALPLSILNAANWVQEAGHRSLLVSPAPGRSAGFALQMPTSTGVHFTNRLDKDRFTTNQIYLNGAGVAAGDVDGDGWCDLYFCAIQGENALYRNLGGWQFENITTSSGVGCRDLDSTGAAFADIDGDADLDLLVNSIGQGTRVFLNDGKGKFTLSALLNPDRGGTSLALADIDGDGDLDLYIANYRTRALRDLPGTTFRIRRVNGIQVVVEVNGRPTTEPDLRGRFSVSPNNGIVEHGEADAIFRNDGHGQFTSIPFTGGTFLDEDGRPLTDPPYDWALAATFRDLNGDGWPDLYICSDFDSPDRVWMNSGKGTFKAIAAVALRSQPKFSMGVDMADINRDGFDDILAVEMLSRSHQVRLTRADRTMETSGIGQFTNRPQLTRNTLHLNRGDGTYAEIACLAGLDATGWSWSPAFLDIDLDGYEDLLVTTGHGRDDMDADSGLRIEALKRAKKLTPTEQLQLRTTTPAVLLPQLAYRNLGNLRFEEMSTNWGLGQAGIGHGLCLADLDNDGDLDVVINRLNSAAAVYRNETSASRIAVRLRGLPGNTAGIGARLLLRGGPVPEQTQEMQCGGRYLSGDQSMRVFAGSPTGQPMELEIRWRSGSITRLKNLQSNRIYEAMEQSSAREAPKEERPIASMFMEQTLGLIHQENAFDDFVRQPLLMSRLSQLGPGVGWVDVDGDGWDDVVLGSGKGGQLSILRNTQTGRFEALDVSPYNTLTTRDQAGVCALNAGGKTSLLVASANYEDASAEGSPVLSYNLGQPTPLELLPGQESSSGALALSDLDGDGDLDLFVGARALGGRYPFSPSSSVWRNEQGRWQRDEANSKVVATAGMVTGALWTDLDGDDQADLVLACDWGPVRVFKNERGRLREITTELGLNKRIGWWGGVSAGDFDEDGRMDLIIANWGLNNQYQVTSSHGRRIQAGDLTGAGRIDIIESLYDSQAGRWFPERDLLTIGKTLPYVREHSVELTHYAGSTMEAIFGDRLKTLEQWEVNFLETVVLLNRGNHFDLARLPLEVQFSATFGVAVADLDGDGHEDAVLGQNFFNTQGQTSRSDAGRGLVLRGDGRGGFTAMTGKQSGLAAYGEGRGLALGDYDQDGRVDLLMAQNGGPLKLYRNQQATPGLRVHLRGKPSNASGVGARLRVEIDGKWGPSREVRAGGGYWSQDSLTSVLGCPKPPTRLEVRWPQGLITLVPIAAGQRELIVEAPLER